MATIRRIPPGHAPDSLSNGWLVALGTSLVLVGVFLGLSSAAWLSAILAAAVIAAIAAVVKNILRRRSTRHQEESQSPPSGEASVEVDNTRETPPKEDRKKTSGEWGFSVKIFRKIGD
jgi:outer membrane biosynthesis protein TonB